MPQALRLGDLHSGHDDCGPTNLVVGSGDVYINDMPAGRMGDFFAPHGCEEHDPHPPTLIVGSGSVYINGMPAGRLGDNTDCGATVITGSENVLIG